MTWTTENLRRHISVRPTHSLAKNFPPWADDFLTPHLVSFSRKRKWVAGSMWPNSPTHQSDIFFAKGVDERCKGQRWHRMTRKVSSTSSQHAKRPDLKCHRRMFPVSGDVRLHFHTRFPFCRRHFSDKSVRARRGRAEGAGAGWKWMSSGWARDGGGRRAGRKMCLPLKSPAAVRHNTIRLEIVFSSPSARLIPALARLFSFICLAPLYCHNAADPESSHRSLVQLISEVAALQIRSLNFVSPYIRWRDHTFGGGLKRLRMER